MSFFSKHKLAIITTGYFVLLLYILSALLWWFIALNKQNNVMANLRLSEIKKDNPAYPVLHDKIINEQKRKVAQYIGEGSIFLVLILVGAVFVYHATRKQLRLSHQQNNFMMAVTHELKTPIAVARLNLETLQKRKLDEEKQNKLINNTLYEADRLNSLCNNILLAAQLDGGIYHSSKQKIKLTDLIDKSVHEFQIHYPQRKINALIDDDIYILGEEVLLQMLMNNLIENAVKYSPRDKAVTIELKEKDAMAYLSVIDEGAGIADTEKKKIFYKFYRIGDESTRTTKGTGLGLYLSKKIMQKHRGKIIVSDNMPTGSIFTAIFKIS
jgi:signal transduction histidine kinase